MNILICTSMDLNLPCAAINRINHYKESLSKFGIKIFLSGAKDVDLEGKRYEIKDNEIYFKKFKRSFFLRDAFKSNLHAGKFYKHNLSKIIKELDIRGIIIYSMYSTLLEPIAIAAKKEGIFVVNDGGEKYSVNFKNILNGTNYMQYRAIFYSFKKLDGLILCSPRWQKYAASIRKKSILVPSFISPQKNVILNNNDNLKKKFRIVFMGSFIPREMPKRILKSFQICKSQGYNFELIIIGRQGNNLTQKIYLSGLQKKLINNKDLIFTGFVSNTKKDELLQSADCLVILRPPCKETFHLFPTRLPEYLNTGKPVILSDVEPFSVFFKHKKEVFFISNKNKSIDLANAFIELYSNKKLSAYIGLSGRKYANKFFSYKYLGNKIAIFLKEIDNLNIKLK